MKAADRTTIGALWEQDLRFADIAAVANREGFDVASVYVDVMPAFISAMRRLAAQNLAEEDPSRAVLWLFHTHPPIAERIDTASRFTASPEAG